LQLRIDVGLCAYTHPHQLVLQIERGDRAAARAVNIHPSRREKHSDRLRQRPKVEDAQGVFERPHVVCDHLVRGLGQRVAGSHGSIDRGRRKRQLAREGDLEVLVAVRADAAAESEDGRIADAAALRELSHRQVNHFVGMVEHVLADLLLLFVQRREQATNGQ